MCRRDCKLVRVTQLVYHMCKLFAKFNLIVRKIYKNHRSRYFSTNTDRDKANYLEVKAGLLQISSRICACHCLYKRGKNFEFGNFRKDPTVDEHPTLCVKQSMNREQLEREKKPRKGGGGVVKRIVF